MANILVTGGAGFIGSCFVHQLVEHGDTAIVLDAMTYAGRRENLGNLLNGKQVTLAEDTICNGGRVLALLQKFCIDAIVHFAAESHVDNSIAAPAAFIDTNVVGTYQLLEAARNYWTSMEPKEKAAFRFIQISTDEVFGALGEAGHFTEQSPYRPNSPYSASKAAGDHLARAWFHTYGLPVIVTNCSNNYGPRQHAEKLIPHMISCALEGSPLPVYGEGKNIRDWIHVEDHCRGIHLAMTKGKPGETYLFGGRAEKKNIDVVTTICTTLDQLRPRDDGKSYTEQISFVKDRPGHDWRYAIDDRVTREALGFTPQHDFSSGLKATLAWYLEHPEYLSTSL